MRNLTNKIRQYGIAGSLRIVLGRLGSLLDLLAKTYKISKAKLISEECYIIKEVQGSRMLLKLNDVGISQELFFTGVHEPESTEQIKKELKPGMTIIEVGANIGYYSLIETGIIGQEGRIIAFEPSPANMLTLKANIALNNLERTIETHQLGIGSITGRMRFHLMNKSNTSSFYHRQDGGGIKTEAFIDVDVTTLDEFLRNRPIKIDYLRMDVEGFEYEAVVGMEKLLRFENAPEGLFIEVHSQLLNENGFSCKKFLDLLGGFGYQVFVARYRGKASILVRSNQELLKHSLCESGYWEAFFRRSNKDEHDKS